jgi:hypothetical protein
MLSEWWIRVRPLPRDVPAARRVAQFLKAALRSWGLKCEAIRAKPPEDLDVHGLNREVITDDVPF